MNTMVLVIVVAYLLLMLFIGWISSKKIKTNEDFMVAGRRLGPILLGIERILVCCNDGYCVYRACRIRTPSAPDNG